MLIILQAPDVLRLPLCRLWNGMSNKRDHLAGFVHLNQTKDGFLISSYTPVFSEQNKPFTKEEWNVSTQGHGFIKIFFVEQSDQYLEVSLDIAGSYRICGFDEMGKLLTDFSETAFSFEHAEENNQWVNNLSIPWEFFPTDLKAVNAFFLVQGEVLAYHPIEGVDKTHLHQIKTFPFVRLG